MALFDQINWMQMTMIRNCDMLCSIHSRHPSSDGPTAMKTPLRRLGAVSMLAASSLVHAVAQAQDKVLNLYSARHYQTDEALYADFTKATGVRINRIEADDAGILARLKAEGSGSPADVILLVDAARLWRGEQDGLFQPVKSAVLEQRIPAQFRGGVTPQGAQWFGMSTRARVVVYDKVRFKPEQLDTYEKLATPA